MKMLKDEWYVDKRAYTFTALRDSFVLSYNIVCTHYPYIHTESTDSMMQY